MEILILLGMGVFGLTAVAVLYFVVRAAVRAGNRDARDGKKVASTTLAISPSHNIDYLLVAAQSPSSYFKPRTFVTLNRVQTRHLRRGGDR